MRIVIFLDNSGREIWRAMVDLVRFGRRYGRRWVGLKPPRPVCLFRSGLGIGDGRVSYWTKGTWDCVFGDGPDIDIALVRDRIR